MSISLEWLLNKAKDKIYPITHAKGAIRGNSTVDKDLTALENSMTTVENNLSTVTTRVNNISELIQSGQIGGGSTSVILGVASGTGEVSIPTEGWEENPDGGYILDITNTAIEETTIPVVAVAPTSFDAAKNCGLKSYCKTLTGILRLYSDTVPTVEIEASIALIGSGDALPKATTTSAGVIRVGNGVKVEPTTGTLSVDPDKVITQDEVVDEEEALEAIRTILNQ